MVPSSKHTPTRVDKYFAVHESVIEQFRHRGIITGGNLDISWDFYPLVSMLGELECRSGLKMYTEKVLQISETTDGVQRIHTIGYTYNLWLVGIGNIFRYDNYHPHTGHHSAHHVHRFEPPGSEMKDSPFELDDGWPTLGEALLEADQYFWEHLFPKQWMSK